MKKCKKNNSPNPAEESHFEELNEGTLDHMAGGANTNPPQNPDPHELPFMPRP